MKALLIQIVFGYFLSSRMVLACQSLPNDLFEYMDSLEISYTQINKQDLDPFVFEFTKNKDVQIVDDFDGDGQVDFALLLKTQQSHISIVVFLRRGNSFIHKTILTTGYDENLKSNKVAVDMVPLSGTIEGVDETIELIRTGIYAATLWSPVNSVHYWKDDEFVSLPLSD